MFLTDRRVKRFDQCLALATGFIGLNFIVYAFSFIIRDGIDWRILLALNPDSYIPVVEELMVFITDFSILGFALIFLSWKIAYQVSKHSQEARSKAAKTLKVFGFIFACIFASGIFWQRYEHSSIFIPLAVFILAGFLVISNTFAEYSETRLNKINSLFWMTLLTTMLVVLSAECIIKDVVGRPRPLSDAYSAYNWGIRRVADEVVKTGESYVGGHSAIFFGMITPMFLSLSKNTAKTCLLIWALLLSFSRVYVAAHFPFCTLMGSVFGFFMGVLTIRIFSGETDDWIPDFFTTTRGASACAARGHEEHEGFKNI